MNAWLTLKIARSRWRLHTGVFLLAAILIVPGRDLWLRYLLLLATVLLHESGHALVALALGSRRVEVKLWPIFARAEVEDFQDRREAWIALAGPLSNLACAGVVAAMGGRWDLSLARAQIPDFLFTVNLLMGIGNLLPVPPADGGRVLRSLKRPRAVPES